MSDATSPAVVPNDVVNVTGATGSVGGWLVPALLEAGYRVRCPVREPRELDARPWRHHPNVEVIDAQTKPPLTRLVMTARFRPSGLSGISPVGTIVVPATVSLALGLPRRLLPPAENLGSEVRGLAGFVLGPGLPHGAVGPVHPRRHA